MCELRCALKRPWSPRVPAWLVRLGSFLLRTEAELALHGRRCIPDRLVEKNFKFVYTNLESALADLLLPREAEAATVPEAPPREAPKGLRTIAGGGAKMRGT
jgi:hypothetical protein